MTRKDFELIAAAIAATETQHIETPDSGAVLHSLVERLSEAIAKQSPRFNAARFEAAALPLRADRLKRAILAQLESN